MKPEELLKEEYITLRAEVESLMDELGSTERYCLYAVGTAFAWLCTRPFQSTLLAAWFIPPVLVIFAMLRSWTIGKQLAWFSEYLAKIESKVYAGWTGPTGWEHFLKENINRTHWATKQDFQEPRRGIRMRVTVRVWIALLALAIACSVAGYSVQSNNALYKWFLTLLQA